MASELQGSSTKAGASNILVTLDAQADRHEAALYPMVGTVIGSGSSGLGVLLSDRWVIIAGHEADLKTNGEFKVAVPISPSRVMSPTRIIPPSGSPMTSVCSIYPCNGSRPAPTRRTHDGMAPVTGMAAATMIKLESPAPC